MLYRLTVPQTIEDNSSVRVLEWHAAPGDVINQDALLVELETHKALIEVRAGKTAILRRREFEEGEWCPLGQTLALLSDTSTDPLDPTGIEWTAEFTIS